MCVHVHVHVHVHTQILCVCVPFVKNSKEEPYLEWHSSFFLGIAHVHVYMYM